MSADRRAEWQQQLREYREHPQRRQVSALLALADLLGRTGKGSASLAEVAKAASVGERTAFRAVAWGKANGWLDQKRGHGHKASGSYADASASEWSLLLPEQPAKPAEQPAIPEQQPAKPSTPAPKQARGRPAPRRAASKSQGRRCSNGFLVGLVDGASTCCPEHDNVGGNR